METIFEYENQFLKEVLDISFPSEVSINKIYFDSRMVLVKYDLNGGCTGEYEKLVPLLDVVLWVDK
jgi:hypothetical protein